MTLHLDDDASRIVYSTDNSIYQIPPEEIWVPTNGEEIAAVVAANARRSRPRPIVARGGGTGTNGQSLTDGVMIDCKRGLDRILEIDVEHRVARVQPGVVTQRLNDELAPLGLQWAPHTSTVSRATVGGMIATDAAGKGSLVHGRAHRHVLALDLVLADGTVFTAEPMSVTEAETLAGGSDRIAELWRALLALDVGDGEAFDLPELARGFSGYGLDRLRRDDVIDPLALLVGAEGTLGITIEATLRLTPLDIHTTLIVAAYPDFRSALEDALVLRDTNPSAIETFDEQTLAAGRHSEAWPALGRIVGDLDGAVLLIEYGGPDPVDPAPLVAAIEAGGRSLGTGVLIKPADRSDAWKVRADAVGLLGKITVGGPRLSARPTAMVEDCAVPVASMVDFITDFRAVLDGFGLTYGMFGHADVGCVHVRPALDLTDPHHEHLVGEITAAVVEIVRRHGGILWGEHGRGFRGDVAPAFLDEATLTLMRQVKTAFDPDDLMNPGKLYRPLGSDDPLVGLIDAPLRGQRNRTVPVEIRRDFGGAFSCNGNGLCQQHRAHDVMCPSYKATGDPALSPKGRADLLREVLRRRELGSPDTALEAEVADNLHQCLSCAACTGTCPIEVDIPELKSRFLELHHDAVRRPASHHVLSHFERLATIAARLPTMLTRPATGPVGRALGLVDLPTPKPATLDHSAPTFDPRAKPVQVVLLPDVFTGVLEPDTLSRAVHVLQQLDVSVAVAPFVPSGKFDHVKGRRARFAKAVAGQRRLVESILATGATPVAIEPAIALLHGHEFPGADPDYPDGVRHLVEILDEHRDELRRLNDGASSRGPVTLLGHCTERATWPASVAAWVRVLEAAGHDVSAPTLGCCGMAGIFGHEMANQEISTALWRLGWDDAVASDDVVVATGFSCRSQAARVAGVDLRHPVHLLI